MKKYGRDGTGAQKFTLLLARLASGDPSREVTLDAIKNQWDKMKGIIGKYNPAYSIRAKDEDWVDTKKQGVYVLKPSWKNVSRSHTERWTSKVFEGFSLRDLTRFQ